jgi:hypothetical protein
MDKVIENGEVAVLFSPGFGAGWYTWNLDRPECLFDPDCVELVRSGADTAEIEDLARSKWAQGDDYFYPGGADCLRVMWLDQGTRFRIEEYDGSENIVTENDQDWLTA